MWSRNFLTSVEAERPVLDHKDPLLELTLKAEAACPPNHAVATQKTNFDIKQQGGNSLKWRDFLPNLIKIRLAILCLWACSDRGYDVITSSGKLSLMTS
jgi:hypothetical protein